MVPFVGGLVVVGFFVVEDLALFVVVTLDGLAVVELCTLLDGVECIAVVVFFTVGATVVGGAGAFVVGAFGFAEEGAFVEAGFALEAGAFVEEGLPVLQK